MHTDEAVNSIKFKQLLENNYYKYDPVEYHGPSLYYLTKLHALALGHSTFKEVDESILRFIPAATGILFLLFLYFIRLDTGRRFVLLAIILTLASPLISYYHRYYIHESLLVVFTFCFIFSMFKYYNDENPGWLILGGIFAGFAFATKETFLISAFSIVISFFLVRSKLFGIKKKIRAILIFFVTFILTSFLLFTSLLTNFQGFIDAFLAFQNYLVKSGAESDHIWPWYYYFKVAGINFLDGYILSEGIILLFAPVGIAYAIYKRNDKRSNPFFLFFSYFTIITAVVYSVIPYKTPWSMITFWQGLILLAASGIVKLYSRFESGSIKLSLFLIILIGIGYSFFQVYLTSFKYCSAPENPYTYSHPENDVKEIEFLVNQIGQNVTDGDEIYISVSMPANDYWPLPWYLRKFNNVAWEDSMRMDISRFEIILSSPEFEEELVNYLYELPQPGERNLYVPLFDKREELRPGIEISGYIKKDLYDEYSKSNP